MTAIPARGARPTDTTESPAAAWRTLEGGGATIEGGLWARRQQINRDAALPHGYRMLEVAGNLENLRIAAGASTYAWANREQGAMRAWVPRATI